MGRMARDTHLDRKFCNSLFQSIVIFVDQKKIHFRATDYLIFSSSSQYVGLSAPMLGALNPLRAVISGENMGYVSIYLSIYPSIILACHRF